MNNTKKLIDNVDHCVDDMVIGMLYAYPQLIRLEGWNVLLRHDIDTVKQQEVTLLSGGGSGHEPAHAGYIGQGMLSGAVLGNVFASPSVNSILAAIRAVAGPKGVLLIVKNYTGDRLNFGIAAEKAKTEGIQTRMVVVDDDIALPPGKGITGGRGIAGTVFAHKIAGALAVRGASLDEIVDIVQSAISNMGTLGIALSTCTIPGSTATTERLHEAHSCEVGMGIHGEPGREKQILPASQTASSVATILVEGVLARLPIGNDETAAVMVNNLGSLPALELSIMTKVIVEALIKQGIRVVRLYSGPFMTSLDMIGLSLTLLRVKTNEDSILQYLDTVTDAPGWQAGSHAKDVINDLSARTHSVQSNSSSSIQSQSPDNFSFTDNTVIELGKRICEVLINAESQLTAYDNICGDGDCGLVMKKGAEKVWKILNDIEKSGRTSHNTMILCNSIADGISEVMGGTSGVLLEILFRAKASTFSNKRGKSEAQDWVDALIAGVQAIQLYGGAQRGMRTMVDAFLPAIDVFKNGGSLSEAIAAAKGGEEETKTMHSLAGRANYVSYELLQGTPDPGAAAVAMAFAALL